MTITFDTPIIVGDLSNQIAVTSMDVVTISFNLAPDSSRDHVHASVTLRDPVSGYQAHFVYQDVETAEYWCQVNALEIGGQPWLQPLLNRLVGDKRLPACIVS